MFGLLFENSLIWMLIVVIVFVVVGVFFGWVVWLCFVWEGILFGMV